MNFLCVDDVSKAMEKYANEVTTDLRKKLDYETERRKAAEWLIGNELKLGYDKHVKIWHSLVHKESEIYSKK
jgi:hypothetical protein